MLPNRVCLKLPTGRLLPASAVGQATQGTEWVPVPDSLEGRLLAFEDEGRPLGVLPAVWYGWPKGRHETRDVWLVSDGHSTREVLAYDVEHALKACGLDKEVVHSIVMKERWF